MRPRAPQSSGTVPGLRIATNQAPPDGAMPAKANERGLPAFRKAKENTPDSSAYVSQDLKNEWYNQHTPLYLHSATREDDKGFGGKPRWVLAISDNEPGNAVGLLTMQANPYRDALFGGLLPELKVGYIGPLMLTIFNMASGQQAWELAEWEPF